MSLSFLRRRNGVKGRLPDLGRLELAVLDQLWQTAPLSALAVQQQLPTATSLSTVQSTLERLARKRLLIREKQGRAYVYAPALGRSQLIAQMVETLIDGLGGVAQPAFQAGDRVDAETLQRLEAWVAACRPPGG